MGVRHLVLGALIGASLTALPGPIGAQDAQAWRVHFAAGEEARKAGNHARYADEMAEAAEALPRGAPNRPSIQYHAARAAALAGRADEAVRWLALTWDEGIQGLMISFAPSDPAFESLIGVPEFEAVMARAGGMELPIRPLGGDVHLIVGAGSNVLAHVGTDGVFLVDTGYGPALPAILSALRSVTEAPVVGVVVTHPHEDHMGGAEALGADAVVYAHPATDAAMRVSYTFMEGVDLRPKAPTALPDVAIERDTTLTVGSEMVRVVPTVAHTNGDLSVYFTESNVAHLGDAFLPGNPMMFPGQTDPEGFLDDLEDFLGEMDDKTVVVGGHEGVADVAAVQRQIDASRACIAFAKSALEDGMTLEEAARAGADRFPPQWIAFFYGVFSQRGR